MLFKSSSNFIKFLIIPMALCAVMFNARCKDDDNDEFYRQVLLNLMSCKGGTMAFTVDATDAKSWTCCVLQYSDSHWIIVGSGGGELIKLHVGTGATAPADGAHNGSSIASNEYIQYGDGSNNFLGITANSGSSLINITNGATNVTGSFSGTVCTTGGATCYDITAGTFTALK